LVGEVSDEEEEGRLIIANSIHCSQTIWQASFIITIVFLTGCGVSGFRRMGGVLSFPVRFLCFWRDRSLCVWHGRLAKAAFFFLQSGERRCERTGVDASLNFWFCWGIRYWALCSFHMDLRCLVLEDLLPDRSDFVSWAFEYLFFLFLSAWVLGFVVYLMLRVPIIPRCPSVFASHSPIFGCHLPVAWICQRQAGVQRVR